MVRRRARLVLACICGMVCVLTLASCSLIGEPSSTESLLVRYAANPKNGNFVAEVSANVTLGVANYRLGIPVMANVEAADDSGCGTVDVDLAAVGEDEDGRSVQLYVERQDKALVWYASGGDEDEERWSRSEVDFGFSLDIPAFVELLSDAHYMPVSYEDDDLVRYELTLPASTLLRTVLGKGGISTSFGEVDEGRLLEALGDSKVHVRFDDECLVRSIALDLDFVYEDEQLLPVPVTVDLDLLATFGDYGTVRDASVAVPASVRNSAKPTDDPLNLQGLSEQVGERLS